MNEPVFCPTCDDALVLTHRPRVGKVLACLRCDESPAERAKKVLALPMIQAFIPGVVVRLKDGREGTIYSCLGPRFEIDFAEERELVHVDAIERRIA